MRRNTSLNQSIGALPWQRWILGVLCLMLVTRVTAQKTIVLTNADLGKVVTGTHHYSERDQSFKLTLKHRLSGIGTVQVSLMKETQFENSPFALKSTLPATIAPDGNLEIEFSVTYSRSLQESNTISLLVVPVGDADPRTRGIAVNIKLSADEVMMFFNERTKQYTKTLPTFEFVGPGEKIIEVTWNGGGNRSCTFKIEDSGRNAFELVPNQPGAAPLADGAEVKLSSGGNSFHIRYDGNAKKGYADAARISFKESGGQTIYADMIGTYQGGTSLFAAARELLTKDNLKGGYNPDAIAAINNNPKNGLKEPGNVKDGMKDNAGKDPKGGVDPTANVNPTPDPKDGGKPVTSPGDALPKPSKSPVIYPMQFEEEEGELTEEQAKERLRKYYQRHGTENIVKIGQIKFEKNDGVFEAFVPIGIDSILKEDPNFRIHAIWVKTILGTDSVVLPNTNYDYAEDSSRLTLKLSQEAAEKMAEGDSFQVKVGFKPEYLVGNTPVYENDLVYTGITYAKMYSNSYLAIFLFSLLGLAVFLFFFIGFLVARKPISSFRYLREARYQRERHKANSERGRVDVETVHIDLARQDTDLVQLAFVDRGEGLDGRGGESIEKVRSINATVPTPRRAGLVRFFSWLYAPFGRKREPKFQSVYYSLRIEMNKGAIPQHLRMKDESGMIMLGTNLTGNVLATDLQDFKFNRRPFGYSIYLDPAEFLDYTGAMRTVSIPFRVVEEPFEGYVMTREFNLNLEIAQRF